MDPEIRQQLAIALAVTVVGVLGWVLPPRFNLLRLRRSWANLVSAETNDRIPKVVGLLLVVLGLTLLIGTFTLDVLR